MKQYVSDGSQFIPNEIDDYWLLDFTFMHGDDDYHTVASYKIFTDIEADVRSGKLYTYLTHYYDAVVADEDVDPVVIDYLISLFEVDSVYGLDSWMFDNGLLYHDDPNSGGYAALMNLTIRQMRSSGHIKYYFKRVDK